MHPVVVSIDLLVSVLFSDFSSAQSHPVCRDAASVFFSARSPILFKCRQYNAQLSWSGLRVRLRCVFVTMIHNFLQYLREDRLVI